MDIENILMWFFVALSVIGAVLWYVAVIACAFVYAIRWPLVVVWAVLMFTTAMEKIG